MAESEMSREDGLERLEEEPSRRPWALVVIIILAVAAALAGIQWRRVADREVQLRAEIQSLQRENETLRLQVSQAQRQVAEIEQRLLGLTAERRDLAQKVEELERRASRTRPPAKSAPRR